MAVGDKKPVVMEEDMAVPGGIATLGTDGKLASEQIPGLEALGAIEYINSLPFTRKNLLDNWYFADPINQRGIALNTAFVDVGQYFIDRWILISGTVTLTANGLLLNGTIRQKRETALNTDFIASVFASSGTATTEYDDTLMYFDITSDGGTIVAAKLEIGTVSTIQHQDADGNLVLNDPSPDKATELAKCQRYYIKLGGSLGLIAPGVNHGGLKAAIFEIPVPVTMRTTPAITDIETYGECLVNGTWYPVTGMKVDAAHAGSVRVFWGDNGISDLSPCVIDGAKFSFSAVL
jgi:hypothetical protein